MAHFRFFRDFIFMNGSAKSSRDQNSKRTKYRVSLICHVNTGAIRDFQKVGMMGDIRQYFKPKTLHLKARLPASVLMATIHAVEKQLKSTKYRSNQQ